jgi:dTDP-4-dehydrorhamnose reductase
MKLLIVGCNGMLGTDMAIEAKKAGHDAAGVDFPDIDITRPQSIERVVAEARPEAIINCAAYTAVDACETNVETAFGVNARGTANLAAAASACGALFVHYSTDYVFDGKTTSPYVESDPTAPLTVYGRSKLEGERLALEGCKRTIILRIAWLYGMNGSNFVKTIRAAALKKAASGESLRVVSDQWGTPTRTVPVCFQTLALLTANQYGVFHATCEGACTWFDFTVEILRHAGIDAAVAPCTTAEYPRPAPRPLFSVLENQRLKIAGLNRMPGWKDALSGFYAVEAASEHGIQTP